MKEKKKKNIDVSCLASLNNENYEYITDYVDVILRDAVKSVETEMHVNRCYENYSAQRGPIQDIVKQLYDSIDDFKMDHLIDYVITPDEGHFIVHDEYLNVLIFLYYELKDSYAFTQLIHNWYKNALLPMYICKLWTTGNLNPQHVSIFDDAVNMSCDNTLLPRHYRITKEMVKNVFYNMFYDASFEEKFNGIHPGYKEELISYYHEFLPDNVREMSDFINRTESGIVLLYNAMECIDTREKADELVEMVEDLEDGLPKNRLIILANMIRDSFDKFDEIVEFCCKRFPDIADIVKNNVKLVIRNKRGILKQTLKSTSSISRSIEDIIGIYYDSFQNEAYHNSRYSRREGGTSTIVINVDMLIEVLFDYGKKENMSYDNLLMHLEYTLKHEFGHAVDHIQRVLNTTHEDYLFLSNDYENIIAEKERMRRENDKRISMIPHVVWYYSYLPAERKANALMGLTLEDMCKSDFVEITPEIREAINNINIDEIIKEEQKMFLELD